jgi:hypothetical protein
MNSISILLSELARCRRQVAQFFSFTVAYFLSRTLFDQTGRLTRLPSSLHALKVMLNFLSIMWNSGTRGFLHPQTTSTLFVSLVTQILMEHPGSFPSTLLCDTLLTALANVEILRVDPTFGDVKIIWKDQSIWQIGLAAGCSNLISACGYAVEPDLPQRPLIILQPLSLNT